MLAFRRLRAAIPEAIRLGDSDEDSDCEMVPVPAAAVALAAEPPLQQAAPLPAALPLAAGAPAGFAPPLPAPQVAAAAAALPLVPVPEPTALAECIVDGHLPLPGATSSGKFYLFTQVEEDGPPRPGRKTPAEVGREGFWNALKAAYAAVFPQGHACHTGPVFGKVVQEGHSNSAELRLRRLHHHAACAFPAEHRWKAIERNLREVQGVKVGRDSPRQADGVVCAQPAPSLRLVCA